MNEYFLVYSTNTGAVFSRGQGPVGSAAIQELPEDLAALPVSYESWSAQDCRLDLIRDGLINSVNRNAGLFRLRYITDVPGQQASYLTKEDEAKAWAAGADIAAFPFLAAEAEYTGMAIGDLVALVLQTAASWRLLAAQIEGRRRGAVVAIAAAGNIAAMVAAATIDWEALTATVHA